MKKIILSLTIIAFVSAPTLFAEEKKCDKDKKACAGKEQSSCCSKKGAKSACTGGAVSKQEVLSSPKFSTK